MPNTDPYAMVKPGSTHQLGLLALGWTTTDTLDGWDHMEPPLGRPMIVAAEFGEEDEPMMEPELEPFIIRERLELGPTDILVVTAEDCLPQDIDLLRENIDHALANSDYPIVANFDITFQVIGRPAEAV